MIFKESEVERIAQIVRLARRTANDPLTIRQIVRLTLANAAPMTAVCLPAAERAA